MLTISQKAFVIMDQLRREAGISVPQMHCLIPISESSYSRISKSVYAGDTSGLDGGTDIKVQLALRVFIHGFTTNVLSATTMKHSDSIIDVLNDLKSTMPTHTLDPSVDVGVKVLLSKAVQILS